MLVYEQNSKEQSEIIVIKKKRNIKTNIFFPQHATSEPVPEDRGPCSTTLIHWRSLWTRLPGSVLLRPWLLDSAGLQRQQVLLLTLTLTDGRRRVPYLRADVEDGDE